MGVSWQIGNKTVQSLHIGNKEVQSLKDITNNKIIWEKASAPVTQPILEPVKFIVDFDSIYSKIENEESALTFGLDWNDYSTVFDTIEDYLANIQSKDDSMMYEGVAFIDVNALNDGEFIDIYTEIMGTITGNIATIEFPTLSYYQGICIFVLIEDWNTGEWTIPLPTSISNINGQTIINYTI